MKKEKKSTEFILMEPMTTQETLTEGHSKRTSPKLVEAYVVSGKLNDGTRIAGLLVGKFVYYREVRGNKKMNSIYEVIKKAGVCDMFHSSYFGGSINKHKKIIVNETALKEYTTVLPF